MAEDERETWVRRRALSRRELIKRSAIAGGVIAGGALAWETPRLGSLSPISASRCPGSPSPCTTKYAVKFEPQCNDATSSPSCFTSAQLAGVVAGACGKGPTVKINGNNNAEPPPTWTVTLPSGCRFIIGCLHAGTVTQAAGTDNCNGTVTFAPPGRYSISSVALVFCC